MGKDMSKSKSAVKPAQRKWTAGRPLVAPTGAMIKAVTNTVLTSTPVTCCRVSAEGEVLYNENGSSDVAWDSEQLYKDENGELLVDDVDGRSWKTSELVTPDMLSGESRTRYANAVKKFLELCGDLISRYTTLSMYFLGCELVTELGQPIAMVRVGDLLVRVRGLYLDNLNALVRVTPQGPDQPTSELSAGGLTVVFYWNDDSELIVALPYSLTVPELLDDTAMSVYKTAVAARKAAESKASKASKARRV